MNSDDISNQVV